MATVSPAALLRNTAGRTQAGAKVSVLLLSSLAMDGSIGRLVAADHGNSHNATAYETGRWKNLALAGTLLTQSSELVCAR